MRYLNDWKQRTILGSAVLGAGYGGWAATMNPAAGLTVFGTAITMVIGAALSACVASALCRCYQVWQAICRGQLQPASHDRPPKNTMLLPTSVVSRDFARQPPSKHCAP